MKQKSILIIMLALLTNISAFAHWEIDGFYYDVYWDCTATVTGCREKTGSLNIPSSIYMTQDGKSWSTYTVTSIGDYAFGGHDHTSVTIPESVTRIGDYAFQNCWGLTSLTIPGSVMSIGDNTFSGCYFKYSALINNSTLTSGNNWGATLCDDETIDGLVIKDGAAVKCRPWATSVTIPNSVTSIDNSSFYNCSSLTSVTIPNSVTSIGDDAFRGCI